MANSSFLSVSELSFDGIKSNLKSYMQGQDVFADYDFEGSNISALLDILSYNTYMNAYYLNMVGGESFLDSSIIKSSVVSHAKELNYIPRSRTSARAKVTFTVNTGKATPNFVVIPENYIVKTTVDGVVMDFSTTETLIIYPRDGIYVSEPVFVYEGKIVTETFSVANNARFTLKSEYIDTESIKVNVQTSSTDTTSNEFIKAENLLGIDSYSKVFFIQGYGSNQYEILFGDGIVGTAVNTANIVKVKYRSTNGFAGNRASSFSPTTSVSGYSISVTTNTIATNGAEAETIDSIKFYAPRHYSTQYRAVTKDDYINLIRERYPQIKTINVYGGEEADPPQYGRVLISLVPNSTVPTVPDELKLDIINYLKTKSITTEPYIVDPEYIYVEVTSNVLYDPSATTLTPNGLVSLVKDTIQQYDVNHLTEFGSDLRKSKLAATIDNAEISIISNSTNFRAIYKITPIKTINNNYKFSFGNALARTSTNNFYYNGDIRVVSSSMFSYYDPNSKLFYDSYISDDGRGNLIIYYTSLIRQYEVLVSNAGTIDYTTGNITLDITPYSYTGTIDIYVKLLNDDITVNTTKFLKIDYSKTSVNLLT